MRATSVICCYYLVFNFQSLVSGLCFLISNYGKMEQRF